MSQIFFFSFFKYYIIYIEACTFLMFSVPVVGVLSDARTTCIRSFLSTLVEPNELGEHSHISFIA